MWLYILYIYKYCLSACIHIHDEKEIHVERERARERAREGEREGGRGRERERVSRFAVGSTSSPRGACDTPVRQTTGSCYVVHIRFIVASLKVPDKVY